MAKLKAWPYVLKEDSCYKCVHHSVCKFEPNWQQQPLKNDEAADKWYKCVPQVIAEVCSYYKERQSGN